MTRKLLLTLAVALVAMGTSATVASALSGATATLTVTEAHKVGTCNSNGQQQVDATGDLTITNNSGAPITLVSAAATVNGHNGVSNTVFNANANLSGFDVLSLPGGGLLNNNGQVTLHGLTFSSLVPCDVNDAQLCVVVSVLNQAAQDQLDQACSTIISSGNSVPMGTIGGVSLAVLLGLGLVAMPLVNRRRRARRSPAPYGTV